MNHVMIIAFDEQSNRIAQQGDFSVSLKYSSGVWPTRVLAVRLRSLVVPRGKDDRGHWNSRSIRRGGWALLTS
jgi:hypothetical protein